MGWLDKRRTRLLFAPSSTPGAPDGQQTGAPYGLRFVPARWLVLLLGLALTVLSGGKVAKLGVASLVWSVTPRPVKLVAAGVVVTWMLVVAGALAAITLLTLQVG